MRDLILLSMALALTLLPAPDKRAVAEEDGPDVPIWGAAEVAYDASLLPDGFAALSDDAPLSEGAPSEAMLSDLGQAVGLDESVLVIETRAAKKGDAVVVVSYVDVNASPDGFRAVLDKGAASGGWTIATLGTPMRLLVVGSKDASAAKALAAFARDEVVYKLAENGWDNILERSIEGRSAGMARLRAARNIEEQAGIVAAIGGFLQSQQDRARAVGAWIHALKEDTPVPPRGVLRIQTAMDLGQALLEANRDEVLETALGVLQDAVKNEDVLDLDDEGQAMMAFGNRYNLACTYARLGQVDSALEALEKSLAVAKSHLPADSYALHHRHCEQIDPDMESLREDERFTKLLERFAPVPAPSDDE